MSLPNNPLKQYFRRPSVFLTLPSGGKFYADGIINKTETGELPVYPMTAIDEITAKTPDALFNGEAVTQVIQSCVPNILKPWEINNVDLDAILIAIRTASGENDMDMESECPSCNETTGYTVELNKILLQLKCPDFDSPMEINGLKIKFRPLVYRELNQINLEQFTIQRTFLNLDNIKDDKERTEQTRQALKLVTDTTMKIVASAIEYIEANETKVTTKEYILDFLVNCDKNVYTEIRDYTAKIREATQVKPMHIVCPNCKHEYDQPFTLNMSDFFG
jgi:hypothetical protein